jgi:thiosulfate/3-mercaptopyruvate sulfurtransferase
MSTMASVTLHAMRAMGQGVCNRGVGTLARRSALLTSEEIPSILSDKDTLFVDTAQHDAYLRAHIPGAIASPIVGDLKENQSVIGIDTFSMMARAMHLTKEKRVVFYDTNMTTSARFWWVFNMYGHKNTRILDGGWHAYVRSGAPVSVDTPAQTSMAPIEVPAFQRNWLASKQDVLEAASRGGQIVDARTEAEYTGADRKRNIRGGHVPGAININHTDFLGADGRLKPMEALTSLLTKANVDLSKPSITYCQAGIRAALAAFVIHQAGGEVAVYDGSMGDWLNDSTTPIQSGKSRS